MQLLNLEMAQSLQELVKQASENSYVPYSRNKSAVLLLLSDGTWIVGVRVENASYSLVIPPLMNALSTAIALGRSDVSTLVSTHPLSEEELSMASEVLDLPYFKLKHFPFESYIYRLNALSFVPPTHALDPCLKTHADGVTLSFEASSKAHIPESDFPVGCALMLDDERYILGCNVETSDWQHIICAERNALGTAISYGIKSFQAMYISCPKDMTGTPCGACRQVMYELATELDVVMDRGKEAPFVISTKALLPFSFTGDNLKNN